MSRFRPFGFCFPWKNVSGMVMLFALLWVGFALGLAPEVVQARGGNKAKGDRPAVVPMIEKKPAPSGAEYQAALRLIRKLYRKEYATRDSVKRAKLAKTLLQQGLESGDKPVDQYALFDQAREHAVIGGEPQLVLTAIDEMAQRFLVDAIAMRVESLIALARQRPLSADAAKRVMTSIMDLIDESVAKDDYALALRYLTPAQILVRRSGSAEAIQYIHVRKIQIVEQEKAFGLAKAAIRKLNDHPDDKEANLIVGRFYCFFKHEFEQGLPYLAKSSDLKLVEIAKLEMTCPADTGIIVKLADMWWNFSASQPPSIAIRIKIHAGELYKMVVSRLKGLEKKRIQLRIELVTPKKPRPASKPKKPEKPKVHPLLKKLTTKTWTAYWQSGIRYTNMRFSKNGDWQAERRVNRKKRKLKGKWAVRNGIIMVQHDSVVDWYRWTGDRFVIESHDASTGGLIESGSTKR